MPLVGDRYIRPERIEAYRRRLLEKTPLALEAGEALKRLAGRENQFREKFLESRPDVEPHTAKRRIH